MVASIKREEGSEWPRQTGHPERKYDAPRHERKWENTGISSLDVIWWISGLAHGLESTRGQEGLTLRQLQPEHHWGCCWRKRGPRKRKSRTSGLVFTLQKTPACVQAERPSYFSGRFSRPCSPHEHRTPGSAFSSISVARVGEHCRRGVVVLNLGFVSFPWGGVCVFWGKRLGFSSSIFPEDFSPPKRSNC